MALLLLAGSCADFERGPQPASPLGPDAGASALEPGAENLSFAADVHPLLLNACGSCHSPQGTASGTGLVYTGDATDDLAASQDFVSASDPEGSRLVSKAAGVGHGAGVVLPRSSGEYELLLRWISDGALP